MSMDPWALFVLSLGLGLLGFVEPCTVGSSLLFVKYLEGEEFAAKLLHTAVFAATRALFIGALGAAAALMGSAFLDVQRWFWVALGGAYVLLGLIYLAGRHSSVMRVLGPKLPRSRTAGGAAALGVVFGLNIPACAAPLLAAVFAASLGTASIAQGLWLMAVFGLALSLPLVIAIFWERARAWLDSVAALSNRIPFWTGLVFVVLGVWSIYLGVAT